MGVGRRVAGTHRRTCRSRRPNVMVAGRPALSRYCSRPLLAVTPLPCARCVTRPSYLVSDTVSKTAAPLAAFATLHHATCWCWTCDVNAMYRRCVQHLQCYRPKRQMHDSRTSVLSTSAHLHLPPYASTHLHLPSYTSAHQHITLLHISTHHLSHQHPLHVCGSCAWQSLESRTEPLQASSKSHHG